MENVFRFIKKRRFDIIVACSVITFIFDVLYYQHYTVAVFMLYVLSYAADIQKQKNNAAERKKNLAKGLVPEDIKNIAFVKDWDETRQKGMVKFCVVYGGIFFGFALCAIISIAALTAINSIFRYVSDDPAHLVNFIGYTYAAGFILGVILYRLVWRYKEQKFIRLTDPLH